MHIHPNPVPGRSEPLDLEHCPSNCCFELHRVSSSRRYGVDVRVGVGVGRGARRAVELGSGGDQLTAGRGQGVAGAAAKRGGGTGGDHSGKTPASLQRLCKMT